MDWNKYFLKTCRVFKKLCEYRGRIRSSKHFISGPCRVFFIEKSHGLQCRLARQQEYVWVPPCPSRTVTETLGTGDPSLTSVTLPEIVRFCARSCAQLSRTPNIKHRSLLMCLNYEGDRYIRNSVVNRIRRIEYD